MHLIRSSRYDKHVFSVMNIKYIKTLTSSSGNYLILCFFHFNHLLPLFLSTDAFDTHICPLNISFAFVFLCS